MSTFEFGLPDWVSGSVAAVVGVLNEEAQTAIVALANRADGQLRQESASERDLSRASGRVGRIIQLAAAYQTRRQTAERSGHEIELEADFFHRDPPTLPLPSSTEGRSRLPEISVGDIEAVMGGLCPGFWPFC